MDKEYVTVKKAGLCSTDDWKAHDPVNMGVERIWNLCESQSDKQNLGGVPASLGAPIAKGQDAMCRPRTRVFLQRRYCWESVLELHHEPLWVMEGKYS